MLFYSLSIRFVLTSSFIRAPNSFRRSAKLKMVYCKFFKFIYNIFPLSAYYELGFA